MFLKDLVDAIRTLERECLQEKAPKAVVQLYDDLAFQKLPLTREIIIMLLQCNFTDNEELIELATLMYASSSSTKDA